jgi:hypothetical protein
MIFLRLDFSVVVEKHLKNARYAKLQSRLRGESEERIRRGLNLPSRMKS